MTKTHQLVAQHVETDELEDMFAELPELEPFEIKKEELATQLSALMVHCNINRSAIADRLHWSKSRVSQVLSGKGNPTMKTVFEFSRCLGFDVDMVFCNQEQRKSLQPWEYSASIIDDVKPISSGYTVVVQSPDEIVKNVKNGTAQPLYISAVYKTPPSQETLPTWQVEDPTSWIFENTLHKFISI